MSNRHLKILLAGDGSGGPIVPLIAVSEQIKKIHPKVEFLLVGTGELGEKFAKQHGLRFVRIPAGKWRRYFTLRNFVAPFLSFAGFIRSIGIISSFSPDVVFGAGGYVSVPVGFAALLLGKKIVIHQQDVLPSLTNKILAPFASKITISLQASAPDFVLGSGLFSSKDKIIWTGNPVRQEILNTEVSSQQARNFFNIKDQAPVFLFLGGGTGAVDLNLIVLQALPELLKFAHVIHSTGKDKQIDFKHPNYHQYPLIENILYAYSAADIVISRAGLSTISELSALKKPSIIVPMPNSHQVANALYLDERHAALILDQELLGGERLISILHKMIYDMDWQKESAQNIGSLMPRDSAYKIAKVILDICNK